jgi:hypothetical protein
VVVGLEHLKFAIESEVAVMQLAFDRDYPAPFNAAGRRTDKNDVAKLAPRTIDGERRLDHGDYALHRLECGCCRGGSQLGPMSSAGWNSGLAKISALTAGSCEGIVSTSKNTWLHAIFPAIVRVLAVRLTESNKGCI